MPKFNVQVRGENKEPMKREVSTKQHGSAVEVRVDDNEVVCFYDDGRVLIRKSALEGAGFKVEIIE